MIIESNPAVQEKLNSYSPKIKKRLKELRRLILDTAKDLKIEKIEETLKWGEPSYLVKKGSTIRMDWKAKNPNQFGLYFKCTSKLVVSFKEVFGDLFKYENKRALLFNLDESLPKDQLKQCIAAALCYHSVKNQKFLGLK